MKRLFAILVLAFLSATRNAYSDPVGMSAIQSAFSITAPGCNAVALTQFNDMPDLFVGRKLNVERRSGNGCAGKTWSLDLLRMDWQARRLTVLRTILQTPAAISGGNVRIDSAYDPYVAKFHNEYWVAFECAGKGIPGASTCLGPFDPGEPEKGVRSLTNVRCGLWPLFRP